MKLLFFNFQSIGGSGVSAPIPRAFHYIKAEMASKIEKNEILLGELIEPKIYEKVIIKEGVLSKEQYTVHGRRIPLIDIRKHIFQEHRSLGKYKIIYDV